jgi:hypothetical protein
VSWLRGTTYGVEVLTFDGDTLVNQKSYSGFSSAKVFWDSTTSKWELFLVERATAAVARASAANLGTWPTTPTNIVVLGAPDADLPYDVAVPAGDYYYIASPNSLPKVIWNQRYKSNDTQKTLAVLQASAAAVSSIAMNATGLVIVWAVSSGNVQAAVQNAAGAEVLAEFTVFSNASASYVAVGEVASSISLVLASSSVNLGDPALATSKNQYADVNVTTGAVTARAKSPAWGWHVASAPLRVGAQDYVLGVTHTDVSATSPGMRRHLLEVFDSTYIWPVPALVCAPYVGALASHGLVEKPQAISRRIYVPAIETAPDGDSTLAVLLSTEINSNSVAQHAYDGSPNAIAVSGGLPMILDTKGATECVPIIFPVIKSKLAATGTGVTGTVQYKAIYEIQDAAGRIGWSAPSPATAAISPSNQRVQITLPELQVTGTSSAFDPRYRLYRSTGGGVYYLVTEAVLTRTQTGFVTIYDTTQDLSANEVLYTESGETPNVCPPFSTCVAAFKGRLWSASGDTLYWSKGLKAGYLPQWCDEFKLTVPARITALAPVGQMLLILCEDPESTYYTTVPGEGPDDLASGPYPAAELFSSEIGCPQALGGASSVVVVNGQAFWRSSRGIEAMGMAQATQQSGPVEVSKQLVKTLASYPVVLDVTHLSETNQIVWCLSDASTGRKLIAYDTGEDAWTTYYGGCFTGSQCLGADGGALVVGSTNGIWRADTTLTYDLTIAGSAKASIVTVVQMILNPFGAGKRGELSNMSLLGEYQAPSVVTLTVALTGPTYSYSTSKTLSEWTVGDELTLTHGWWRKKCARVDLTITCVSTLDNSTYGRTPVLRGMNMPGESYVADKQRFGS